MKPKDFTAWLDDEASPRQCRAVERQLGQAASLEKESWRRIRGLLREHLRAPALEHPGLINARVAEALERAARPRALPRLRRWFWAGAGCLAAASLLALVFLPGAMRPFDESEFLSRIISARGADATVSVSAFRAPRERGVVLWVEGAGFIRPEEKVR